MQTNIVTLSAHLHCFTSVAFILPYGHQPSPCLCFFFFFLNYSWFTMFYQFFLYSRISSLIHSKYNSCIYYPKLPVPPRLSATTSLFSKSITLWFESVCFFLIIPLTSVSLANYSCITLTRQTLNLVEFKTYSFLPSHNPLKVKTTTTTTKNLTQPA